MWRALNHTSAYISRPASPALPNFCIIFKCLLLAGRITNVKGKYTARRGPILHISKRLLLPHVSPISCHVLRCLPTNQQMPPKQPCNTNAASHSIANTACNRSPPSVDKISFVYFVSSATLPKPQSQLLSVVRFGN